MIGTRIQHAPVHGAKKVLVGGVTGRATVCVEDDRDV